jgi:hypothetical protein
LSWEFIAISPSEGKMNISDPRDRHKYIHYLIAYIFILEQINVYHMLLRNMLNYKKAEGGNAAAQLVGHCTARWVRFLIGIFH